MANRKFLWLGSAWIATTLTVAIGMVLTGTALLLPPTAQAVHDDPTPFQLDANALKAVDGFGVDTADDDWDNVFEIGAAFNNPIPGIPRDIGDSEVFVEDVTNDSIFGPGSNKDTAQPNSWTYKFSTAGPDKNALTNAYAIAYKGFDHDNNPNTDGHLLIYFGADRYDNSGDALMSFWFFQGAVGLDPNSNKFTGTHQVGDVLVQVEFYNGGTKKNKIEVLQWVGGANPLQSVVKKEGTNTVEALCTDTDTACALTNGSPITAPWAYIPKGGAQGDQIPKHGFIEGGIDISALVGDRCFTDFLAATRASTTGSESSELKDFALGDFDLCRIGVTKDCKQVADDPTTTTVNETSPRYNPTTQRYETTHDIVISGEGGFFDVSILDLAVGGLGTCQITAITGGTSHSLTLPFTLPTPNAGQTNFTEVGSFLDGGNSMTVRLRCESATENPFANSVRVRGALTNGGTTYKTADYTESSTDTSDCQINLNPLLELQKYCANDTNSPLFGIGNDIGVRLLPNEGFRPEVCVDIYLRNDSTPAQRLVITELTDTESATHANGPVIVNLLSAFQAANTANSTPSLNSSTLEPGESVAFQHCYKPLGPDNNTTDPGVARYSDTVLAKSRGVTAGNAPDETATAFCRLCPTCPDCPPL